MERRSDPPHLPPHAVLAHIDALCDQFEAAWKAGRQPSIEDYVSDSSWSHSPDSLRELLVELVKVDMHYRWLSAAGGRDAREPGKEGTCEASGRAQGGLPDCPELTDYLACYPALGSLDQLPEDLVALQRSVASSWLESEDTAGPPLSAERAIGDLLPKLDRLILQRRIGAGGMGIVYAAYDRQRDEVVAVKTLKQVDPQSLYRLKREFRALSGIVHPNLARLYELFSVEGQWFFTMEFVDGVNFLDFVVPSADHGSALREDPSGSPSHRWGRLRFALGQLIDGVLFLHLAGTLHRDIKPSNVLVTPQGRVVLLDFGLATEVESDATTVEQIVGTVAYMSPEQASADALSPASDWYSVGVMLYEAIASRKPYRGRSLEVLMDKQEVDPPALSEFVHDVPEDLERLCMALLQRDPHARPDGAAMLRWRESQPAPDSRHSWIHVPAPVVPLVGRQTQLEELQHALGLTRRGCCQVVHVRGNSGVGKSALVHEFLSRVRACHDAVVLAGRCYERELVPYKAFDSVVDALSHFLIGLSRLEVDAILPRDVVAMTHVFPVLQRVEAVVCDKPRMAVAPDPQELRDRAFRALRELLARLGDRRLLLLHIDDLQWGDLDSITLLNDLLSPPDPPRLLLVMCYRGDPEDPGPVLRALQQSEISVGGEIGVRHIELESLSDADARELARVILGQQAEEREALCEAIARESGGNPYFIGELARHRPTFSSTRPANLSPEVSLVETLWEGIERLPESARALLETVAAAGHPLREKDAHAAAGLTAEGHHATAVLRAARLIRTIQSGQEEEIEPYHDRVREAVVSRLSDASQTSIHERLAAVLEASGATDSATLAGHFAAAGQRQRAGVCYAIAADEATRSLAFGNAIAAYELAMQRLPSEEILQRDLQRKLADALANAGRGAEAAHQYLAAAESAGGDRALDLRRRAATQLLAAGHLPEGLAVLQRVLQAAGMRLPSGRAAVGSLLFHRCLLRLRGLKFRLRAFQQIPPAKRAKLDICWSASIGLGMVDKILAADFQTRCLLLALECGEPALVGRSLCMEAAHLAAAGSSARAKLERVLTQASALIQDADRPYLNALQLLSVGTCCYLLGDWLQAVRNCQRAEQLFRDQCTGAAWELDTAIGFGLSAMSFAGQVIELSDRLPVVLEEAQRRGDVYATVYNGTITLPYLAADDPDRADRELVRWHQDGFQVQRFDELVARVDIDLYRDQGQQAWDRVEQHWSELARSLMLQVQFLRGCAYYARARSALAAACRAAEPKQLLQIAARDARRLAQERHAWIVALAHLVQAAVAHRQGETTVAMRLLSEAAQTFDAVSMPLHQAACCRRLGELTGGDEGQTLIDRSDAELGQRGVRNPARLTNVFAPGFAVRP